jgi:hypothetical protein
MGADAGSYLRRGYCQDWRYWSDQIARGADSGVEALCLAKQSPRYQRWTQAASSCGAFTPGPPIDTPALEG